MRYIVCTGYISSGSSIVNDLLKEVRGYKTFPIEFKLFTGLRGVFSLENALFYDWDPWKSGEAMEGFCKYAKQLTEYQTPEFNMLSDSWGRIQEFSDRIAPKEYIFGSSVYSFEEYYNNIIRFGKKHAFCECTTDRSFKKIPFIDIDKECFIGEVRKLLDDIFVKYEVDGISNVVLDQGITPYYANRFSEYFPDGKMIIVDRNPLDCAASMLDNGKAIGLELRNNLNASFFIKWFCKMRNDGHKIEADNILYTTYEDVIAEYEKWKKTIFEMLEIDNKDHVNKKQYFDPDISFKRVNKWKNYKGGQWHTEKEWNKFCFEALEILSNSENDVCKKWYKFYS